MLNVCGSMVNAFAEHVKGNIQALVCRLTFNNFFSHIFLLTCIVVLLRPFSVFFFIICPSSHPYRQTCQSIPPPAPPYILNLMTASTPERTFPSFQPSSSVTSSSFLSSSSSCTWASNDGGNSVLWPRQQ